MGEWEGERGTKRAKEEVNEKTIKKRSKSGGARIQNGETEKK